MRRDHRPYIIKRAYLKFQKFYVKHFIRPQLDALGKGFHFMKPWHVELFGSPIIIGRYATVIATSDQKIRLTVWPAEAGGGRILLGDYCLICAGVRISSAASVTIGDNCMIAAGAYITDCDWHDIHNRAAIGKAEPVTIGENAWIGDSAIICKGVTIGENSVVGAGAVVVKSVPANSIVAGNPAKVVKTIDPEKIVKREEWFKDPARLARDFDSLDRAALGPNTMAHWLRHLFFPQSGE